ncbi:unnamed protein product, partial [marine sediment metagenome]
SKQSCLCRGVDDASFDLTPSLLRHVVRTGALPVY